MLLVINNLPNNMRYTDIKDLIQDKSGLTEVILDNLVNDGKNKRVTIGLADEGDAALLVHKINGLFVQGNRLFVEDVRQKKLLEQPYRPMNSLNKNVPQHNEYREARMNDTNMDMMHYQYEMPVQPPPMMQKPMTYNHLPHYMSSAQKSYVSYDKQTSLPANQLQRAPMYEQDISKYNYQQPGVSNHNQWNLQKITSYPAKPRQVADSLSNENDNSVPKNRDKNWAAGKNRDFPSGRDSDWRGGFQSGPSRSNDVRDRDNRDDDGHYNRKSIRYEQSRFQADDRHVSRPEQKSERKNDFENLKRNSRFERSPPRDREGSRSNYERHMLEREKAEHQKHRHSDRHKPRDFNEYNQRFEDFEQKNPRKPNFTSKRPHSNISKNTVRVFSSDPYNSTFTKPNVNFGQQATNTGFSKQDIERDNNPRGPLAKLARFNYDGNASRNLPDTSSTSPNNDLLTLSAKLKQQNQWRAIASSQLAKKVIISAEDGKINNYKEVLQNLRKCIASRLDVILGDKLVNSLSEILNIYRIKFSINDDIYFYKAVLEKSQRDREDCTLQTPGSDKIYGSKHSSQGQMSQKNVSPKQSSSVARMNPKQKYNTGPMNQQKTYELKQNPTFLQSTSAPYKPKSRPTANVLQPAVGPQKGPVKTPKYSKANKQDCINQKKQANLEFQGKCSYSMEPVLQAALGEEVAELCRVFVDSASNEATNELEEKVRQIIVEDSVEGFAKVMKTQLTRRILDIKTHLIIRIFATPKLPKKQVLEDVLKGFGVVKLKKSDKKFLFLASCDSFESYDKLLALQTTMVGDVTLQFKPLHLTGPMDKTIKQYKQKFNRITNTSKLKLVPEKIKKGKNAIQENFSKNPYEEESTYQEENVEDDPDFIQEEFNEDNDVTFDDVIDFTCDELNFNLDDTRVIPSDSQNDSDFVGVQSKTDRVVNDDKKADDKVIAGDDHNVDSNDDGTKNDNISTTTANDKINETNEPTAIEENKDSNDMLDPVDAADITEDDLEDF